MLSNNLLKKKISKRKKVFICAKMWHEFLYLIFSRILITKLNLHNLYKYKNLYTYYAYYGHNKINKETVQLLCKNHTMSFKKFLKCF